MRSDEVRPRSHQPIRIQASTSCAESRRIECYDGCLKRQCTTLSDDRNADQRRHSLLNGVRSLTAAVDGYVRDVTQEPHDSIGYRHRYGDTRFALDNGISTNS